jgi:chloramphenicol 3-O phosphotransferase
LENLYRPKSKLVEIDQTWPKSTERDGCQPESSLSSRRVHRVSSRSRLRYVLSRMSGYVIILNGPSVAGKSSIQRALQDQFTDPHLAMGLDSLVCAMMPQRYFTSREPDRESVMWADPEVDGDGAPLFKLHFGPAGRRVVSGMHAAIAAYARTGNCAIVDYILYESEFLDELCTILSDVKAYFIGVRIALPLLEERERARGTSPPGHARSHYDTVHAHGLYDFEVDTGQESALACATAIADFVRRTPDPSAFATLRRRRQLARDS